VQRRRWLDDASYADTLALCQFLPDPSSSQVAICLGALRAGPLGGLAAWRLGGLAGLFFALRTAPLH